MYGWVIFLHVLAATVWTGGHLVLATTVLPRALRQRSPQRLLDFEQGYERIGMPALLVQVATGLWMAQQMVPGVPAWLAPETPLARAVCVSGRRCGFSAIIKSTFLLGVLFILSNIDFAFIIILKSRLSSPRELSD